MKGNPDMDGSQGHNAEKYVDELLNSFVDGELTFRQQNEVKRLMANDSRIAGRVKRLQKCRMLINSMPRTKAPENILAGVTGTLVSRVLLAEQVSSSQGQIGTKHLLTRKVLSAVAMIALAAVLSIVAYTILTPQGTIESPNLPGAARISDSTDAVAAAPAQPEFYGRLELNTASLMAVNAFIARAIQDNDISIQSIPTPGSERSIYNLACSRADLDTLLLGLDGIWGEFESATLLVDTGTFGKQIVVNAVTAKQITEIIDQDSAAKTVAVAKDYALLNDMAENMPAKEVITALNDKTSIPTATIRIPQPVLTGPEQKTNRTKERTDEEQTVHLTIIVDR